jgi:Kef-type K+ transport system membrane component KefB
MNEIKLGVLFILGMGVFGGMLGAWLFQRLRIPQVVGYIAIGLLLGESGLQLIRIPDIVALRPLNLFALGVIGFLVGGELKIDTFRKYMRQFVAILLGEGLGAFILVGAASGLIMYHVSGSISVAAAAGIVFGAIASATDPASTIDVLWEYRARGVLTTSITAIVALDDALAMTLYGLGTSAAEFLTQSSGSFVAELGKIALELGGAAALGLVFALLLRFLLRWLPQPEKALAISIGMIMLLISISEYAGMDVILAAMTLGFALINLAPRRSEDLFKIMRGFSIPIYVIFFVLVGARLTVSGMPGWLWAIVAVYIVGRSGGKMAGAWLGAKLTGSDPAVRKYLGMGIFAQGGVAIGLSIMASHHLAGISATPGLSLGDAIIFAVTATTLVVQLIGPPMVKLAVKLAGEIGRNITEEDVEASWKVSDAMDKDVVAIPESTPLVAAMRTLVEHDYLVYPVVKADGSLSGIFSLGGMKALLADQSSWDWIIASDVMLPATDQTTPEESLLEVMRRMRELKIDQMPVVAKGDGHKPVGMLDMMLARKRVAEETFRRQQPGHGAKPALA